MGPSDDEQLARFTERADRARDVAPTLVGLPVADARSRIAGEPGLTLREVQPGQAMTMEFRAGRITVVVVDDRVTQTSVG